MATPQRSKAVSASATATECRNYKTQRRRRLKVPANDGRCPRIEKMVGSDRRADPKFRRERAV